VYSTGKSLPLLYLPTTLASPTGNASTTCTSTCTCTCCSAKNIKNEARVNEDLDQKSLLRRYERELKRLRAELEERSRNVVDQRRLLELDEQRRRAEEDKMAAIRALEARSREFMREKQEKKRLEERIQLLQGQIMMGGLGGGPLAMSNLQETPAFRNALKEHQERIRAEYEGRLAELEKERETIEEEKAQVRRRALATS